MPDVLVNGIKTAAGTALTSILQRDPAVGLETSPALIPKVQYYKHFDLADEQLGPTKRYNCWGFTFLPRRYWIGSDADVDLIIADNCTPVAVGALRPGDIVRYRNASDVTTHTGRVWEVDASGACTKVRSKWGSMAEYVHDPLDVPTSYGTSLAFFRQLAPLQGLGDLWIRDATDDQGEQYSQSLWASPDILVDAPPFGGSDVNPVFGQINRVSAIVHNRGDAAVVGARVRYYWADPFAGFAAAGWNTIPGTAGHPNPTNVFSVPANSSIEAPFVEWIPAPVPGVPDAAHQCLLAVAFVGDDPQDSANPNPLVYPFSIRWDNNVAARNVHVLSLGNGKKATLQIATSSPSDDETPAIVELRFRLTCEPRSALFGLPRRIPLPGVVVTLPKRRAVRLGGRTVDPLHPVRGERSGRRVPDLAHGRESRPGVFLPALREVTVAAASARSVALPPGRAMPLRIEVTAPAAAPPGARYCLRVEQLVRGEVRGCYTVLVVVDG